MRKSKNRHFYHIFVSPGDAPGAITLNVVWMEREFDAYKLSRCMCPSNCYRFWETARYWSKIVNFLYPLAFNAPVRGFPSEYRHPLWGGKTRMMSLPMVKKFRRYVYSFWRDPRTWQTDRQTDRRTPGDSKDRAYASHRAVKIDTGTFVQALKECVNTLCECGICRVDLTDKRYWIGLANPSSSYSYWLDGSSSTYRRWATGEPNLDYETCVYYSTEGRFFDAYCGSVNRYVCKKAGGNNTAVYLVVSISEITAI